MKRTDLTIILLLGLFSRVAIGQNTSSILSVNSPNDRIHIYPNPSRGTFYFNGVRSYTIEVIDRMGQRILTTEATSDHYPIDLSSRAKGIYSYKIIDEGEVLQQGKMVVE
jgi:hypothetical protein